MASRGQPTKFPHGYENAIKLMAEKGCTDKEMAEAFNVDERTFNNWKKQKPDFFQSLKDWKEVANEKVKRALFDRAVGYSHPEVKVFNNSGEEMVVEVEKHYPPDTGACMAWLCNRDRDNWKRDPEGNSPPQNIKIDIVNPNGSDTTN